MTKIALALTVVFGLGFAASAEAAGPFGRNIHSGHQGHSYQGRTYQGYSGARLYSGRTTTYRPRGHYDYHDTSHYDYHGPSLQRHGNHYDYVPGHYDYHRTGHYDYHRGSHRSHYGGHGYHH
jgi:hypothetical protein